MLSFRMLNVSSVFCFSFFLFLLVAFQVRAQGQKEIWGTVTDASTRIPLSGASISIKNGTVPM